MGDYVTAMYFMRESYSMLYDHCERMLAKSEWNLAGKTAFDAMEKVAKSVELLTGIYPPKRKAQHEATLLECAIDALPLIAWRVSDDPLTSVSLCVHKRKSPVPHIWFSKVVCGTFTSP